MQRTRPGLNGASPLISVFYIPLWGERSGRDFRERAWRSLRRPEWNLERALDALRFGKTWVAGAPAARGDAGSSCWTGPSCVAAVDGGGSAGRLGSEPDVERQDEADVACHGIPVSEAPQLILVFDGR